MSDLHNMAAFQAMDRVNADISMVGANLAVPEPALLAIRSHIGSLCERAGELSERLEAIGNRVLGPRPQNDAKSPPSPVRSGDIGGINDALDTLGGQILRAHEAMTRLESL